jgi:hypothetical protein
MSNSCCCKNASWNNFNKEFPITTHLQGTLLSPVGEPLPNAVITSEMTDADGSYVGVRVSVRTDENGKYNFKLVGGYHNIYVAKTEDDTEKLIGKVHVTGNDYDTVYTLEALLNK